MWAATGFQKTITGLLYPIMGFITGGLASHNSMSSPNVMPDSHIMTPYSNNIDGGDQGVEKTEFHGQEGTDLKKVIKINSGIIK